METTPGGAAAVPVGLGEWIVPGLCYICHHWCYASGHPGTRCSFRSGTRAGAQGRGAPRVSGLPALSHCTRVSSFPRILPGTQPCPHTRPGLHTGRWRVPETVLAQVKHFPLESGGQEGFTGRNVPWPPSGQGCPGPPHPPGHKTRRNGHSPPSRWTPVLSQTRPCHAY